MLQNNSGFLGSIPFVTRNILIVNVIIWFATYLLHDIVDINHYLGLYYVTSEHFYPHQIITSMFAHDGFTHMFFNMFAIFMFGRTLESVWGPKKFLTYYLLTGIGAAITQEIVYTITFSEYIFNASHVVNTAELSYTYQDVVNILPATVGASGAVFGVLVAFGMLFPNVELIMIPIPIPIKAKWFVIGYGVLELYLGFANNPNDNVAHFAHLGGLVTGLIIILYWRSKARKNGNFF